MDAEVRDTLVPKTLRLRRDTFQFLLKLSIHHITYFPGQ
jgi:hypothetical protein